MPQAGLSVYGMGGAVKLSASLNQVERRREEPIRLYVCPTCEANPGRPCVIVGKVCFTSHVGRYELGVRDGVVPALPVVTGG